MRTRPIIVIAVALGLALALPSVAYAAKAKVTTYTAGPRNYDLDFTLPTAGKSGCMVCHGDPNLVKVSGDSTSSIFVDVQILQGSAHKDTPCTGCHIDFAYTTPHKNVTSGADWRAVAKLACKNCHKQEFSDYASSAHSPAGTPGKSAGQTEAARKAAGKPTTVPLCGDCHAGHTIPSKDDTAALAAYHKQGLQICGKCHTREGDQYVDYYHGAAYRRGAADAPACWNCHGTHVILPANNPKSQVSRQQLVQTCGQEGCHKGADQRAEQFLDYARLIHRKGQVIEQDRFLSAIASAKAQLVNVIDVVRSWFKRD